MLGYLLSPVLQIEDTNGLPLVNGKVYVYEANTSNLATIYSNYEGTYNTNPAILDLAGHTTIIADDSILYDITIKDADDNLLFSAEDIAVGGEGGSAIVTDVSVQAGNNGITVSQSVVNQTKVFKVFIDYNFVASKSDLALKQDKLSAGPNIDITNNVVSGKDWQDEIDDAVAAVATGFIPYSATNIPAGSSVSVYGDNMLLVGKNITGIAYGNLAVGENINKTAPNGLLAGSGINGSQNDILVGNGVSAGNNALVLGDTISSLGTSIIIGGPSITGTYGESTIVAGNNNLTGMGNHNVVLGHTNTATSGNDNVIIGRGNSTTGSENIVIGIDNSSNSGTIFGGKYNQVNNFGYIYGGSYNSATNAAAVLNGDGCYASGTGSVAEGLETSALGDDSHAEGSETYAYGYAAHAEGSATSAIYDNTHSEGIETIASGNGAHAEGASTSAFGSESHTEGVGTYTKADAGAQSHAEGWFTSAVAVAAHAEGDHTVASGVMSHAEGGYTSAQGNCSHAEGSNTIAYGNYSHAEGHETIAAGEYQTVIGKYNAPNDIDVFQIGCGSADDSSRKNAFVVSPSSQALSSNNTYVIDENGSITEYPTTVSAKIDEPNTKVWAIMTHVGNTTEDDNPEIVSINKNIILPKFFPNTLFKKDEYFNKWFERWDSYYNPGYNNNFRTPYYENYQGYFTQTASTTDIDNTVDIIAKAKSLGFVPVPENYFTIIPKGENGLYKIDFTLTVKGGYNYNNSNKDELQRCKITPVFSNYSNVVDAYVDYYKGFPTSPAQTQLNRYNFTYYVYRYAGEPDDRVALTGLKFYAQNMRWNVSDTYSQFFNLNFRRTKVREYDGPTYKTQDVTIENELG